MNCLKLALTNLSQCRNRACPGINIFLADEVEAEGDDEPYRATGWMVALGGEESRLAWS